ncbi:MAG: Crp/Fnr family transcriptional regulator [Pseudomonadota bacterium]
MTPPSIETLQQMPVFGGLSELTLGTLMTHAPALPRAPGQAFFRQGEDGDSLFVLLHGRALAVWETDTLCYVLRSIAVGDSYGEAAHIDLQPRSYTAVAQSPCIALEIGPDTMHRVWQQDLEQMTLLHMNIGREMSRRLRDSDAERVEHWVRISAGQ